MRDLDLKTLRLWVAVCDCQNISQAAAQAHIEPSAVSKRLSALEATLGTPLLLRGRRGVQPTPAGLALLEHARTVLFTIDRISADAAAFAGGLRGQVRLVASASAVAQSLLDDVAAFMAAAEHQGIQVQIEERLSTEVARWVRDSQAAIGVCWDRADLGGLATLPYHPDELVLALPPGHALARDGSRGALHFADVLDHPQVGLPPATAVYAMLQRAAAQAGRTLNYRAVVSNFDAALRVVKAGLGVTVIPRQVARPLAEAGALVLRPLADPWARRRFAVCFRGREQLAPAALRLVEHLAARAVSACSPEAA
ncbi:LysR family transcriptional regulator [Aquabacterium sp. OR-4]|uniref:LysR family transcriptional regulator n=1 Tax=Aquabacterium sp. OR-4 TaxID=2978127 RepID=UPI0028C6910B|nr:LysR family transcriptional regulator [Aquabacterium sp. OR-4]MDT7838127.1 LysR family transcriptional regulator [Aquabacterium sp. OR-4]